jgi:hypothetical protein
MTAQATISSGKSKSGLKCAMDSPALPHGFERVFPLPRSRPPDKRLTKNLGSFLPCNPLISLDPDERIQGNPRKSNPPKAGFSKLNSRGPRKPKRVVRTDVVGRADCVRMQSA